MPLAIALSGATAACSSWYWVPAPAPARLPERQKVQVWIGGRPKLLDHVEITADSLIGVAVDPLHRCDSCRVALARDRIDSLRLQNPNATNEFSAGGILGFLGGFFLAIELFRGAL